jgi:orotate phosphoribosyltransferase
MGHVDLIEELERASVIKRGHFTLKSGATSSIYIDLRPLVSHPSLLRRVSQRMWDKIEGISFDSICGVPYTALPIATCMSLDHDVPMLLARQDRKAYGTKKQVEGVFSPGQRCLMVEDVVTTGGSVMETAEILRREALEIHDVVVFVERDPQARAQLAAEGYRLHAVFTLEELQ